MGLFSGNKSRSSTSTVTDIDETNISTSEADNRIAQQGSTQGGSAKVSGNVAGNLILQTSDASGEVIALASNVIEIGGRANDRAIDFAGSAVDAAGKFGLAALEQNSENLDTIVGLSLKSQDRTLDFAGGALKVVSDAGKQTTGFLTKLTDNVLARDAVLKTQANFEGTSSEILRSLNEIGTTGSQGNEKVQTIAIAAVVLGSVALLFMFKRMRK